MFLLVFYKIINMNYIYTWKIVSNNNKYSWEAFDKDMNLIGKSNQNFDSIAQAELNADYMGRDGDVDKNLDWSVFENDNKTWSWRVDDSAELKSLGYSHKTFETKSLAMKNANQFGFNWRDGLRSGVDMSGMNESDLMAVNRSTKSFTNVDMSSSSTINSGSNSGSSKMSDIASGVMASSAVAGGVVEVASKASSNNVSSNVDSFSTMDYNNSNKASNVSKIGSGVKAGSTQIAEETAGGMWGWLKWLLPLLLLLLLLFWLVPGFKTMFTGSSTNNSSVSLSGDAMSKGFNITKLGNIGMGLKAPEFSKFANFLNLSDLSAKINQMPTDSVTLLAPKNDAFKVITDANQIKLQNPANLSGLQDFVNSYFLKGKVNLMEIKDNLSKGLTVPDLETLSGDKITPVLKDGKLMLDGINVEDLNSSGVDGTYNLSGLLPDSLTEISMLKDGGEAMGNSAMSVSSSSIVSVLTSSSSVSVASVATPAPVAYIDGGVMKTVQNDPRFTTLFKAIEVAGLGSTLDSGEFTIFAPTDDAFKTVASTVDTLLKPENKTQLQNFLKNHVVAGKNNVDKFYANTEVTTLAGNKVRLHINESGFGTVIGAKNTVEAPIEDINTPKSVIHIITNSPLLP